MKFTFDPCKECVDSCDKITAAEEEQKGKSLEELVDEKLDNLSDNFDYFVAGVEKLCREDNCQEAISIIDTIEAALNNAIGAVSDNFAEAPVESSTEVKANSVGKCYRDNGAGLGEKGDTFTMDELRSLYNELKNNDPIAAEYESFREWFKDTVDSGLLEQC